MNKIKIVLPFLGLLCIMISCSGSKTVRIKPSEADYTPIVKKILSSCPEGVLTLKFAKGTYHFFPENASERYLVVSNNDNGLKRIIFDLAGRKGVSIVADEAEFIFHGAVVPFAVTESTDVLLEGFSVDWDYPFTMEGEVVSNDPETNSFTLRIHKDNKYEIAEGHFVFKGYDWKSGLGENIVFDKSTRDPYYHTSLYEHNPWKELMAEDLGDGLVKFSGLAAREVPPVGSVWVDKGMHSTNRRYPAIFIGDSRNVSIKDVHVFRSGAMALIAEYSGDISVERFSTEQKEGRDRMITASADATHFVDCCGEISLKDCRFESMLDDATNIHGTYMYVKEMTGNSLSASFGHFQQEGNHFADEGDLIAFIDRKSLRPIGSARIVSLERFEENDYHFTFDSDVPSERAPESIAIENISRSIEKVLISGCEVRHNRARSLLLSCGGDVLVENCSFASMMAGIRICGDANYWFESGRTSNIVVRGNTFEDLGKGGHSPQAILQIDPVIPKSERGTDWFYHHRISFEDNLIRTFDRQVVYALNVAELELKNNMLVDSRKYPPLYPEMSVFDLLHCGKVSIVGNDFSGWAKDATISVHECLEVAIDNKDIEVVDSPNPYFYQD